MANCVQYFHSNFRSLNPYRQNVLPIQVLLLILGNVKFAKRLNPNTNVLVAECRLAGMQIIPLNLPRRV